MPKEILAFLGKERVGVIAVRMPDGTPHAATVHFAYHADPLTFVFLTDRTYRKMQPLLAGETSAALVIGTNEQTMRTLQLNGKATAPAPLELVERYFEKFPEKREKYGEPNDVFFCFTPTWWRYTDYTSSEGKRILGTDSL